MAQDISVKVDPKQKTITIVAPLQKATRSGSGKTMVVASSRGNIKTDQKVDGETLVVGFNCYYKTNGEAE